MLIGRDNLGEWRKAVFFLQDMLCHTKKGQEKDSFPEENSVTIHHAELFAMCSVDSESWGWEGVRVRHRLYMYSLKVNFFTA